MVLIDIVNKNKNKNLILNNYEFSCILFEFNLPFEGKR